MLTVRTTGADEYGTLMKVLLCGDAGAGKTRLSSTFPDPFFVSAEGGLMSIADRNVPYVNVLDSNTLLEIKRMLDLPDDERDETLGFPIRTVVIDTIDEIQNILVRERLTEEHSESMQLRDWGWLAEQMKAIVRGFRNLPLNVVFTCHLKEISDGDTGATWFKPALSGQMGDQIPSYVDLAVVLETSTQVRVNEDNKTEHVTLRNMLTVASKKYPFLKDRSGKLPVSFEVNLNDDYQRLFETIFDANDLMESSAMEIVVPGSEPEPSGRKTRTKKSVPSKSRKDSKPDTRVELTVEKRAPDGDNKFVDLAEEEIDGKKLKRFKYVVDGDTVLSRNQLPDDVLPLKGVYRGIEGGSGENIFCVECGAEMDQEQAEMSKIRYRKIYCREHFNYLNAQ